MIKLAFSNWKKFPSQKSELRSVLVFDPKRPLTPYHVYRQDKDKLSFFFGKPFDSLTDAQKVFSRDVRNLGLKVAYNRTEKPEGKS